MAYTSTEEFDEALRDVRAGFASGITRDKAWRKQQLKRAYWMVEDNRERILEALRKDMNKHRFESMFGDVGGTLKEILDHIENFDAWTRDEKPTRANIINFVSGPVVRKEPLGVSLIIGAWNFPFSLTITPLVAAIAAGCAAVVKPSDVATHTQDILMEIVPKYLDTRVYRCVTAGPKEMGHILEQRFDHIFYTGSANVAKIIYAAAAKYLTPVTLELGGQGPAIVCKSADVDLAAKRIATAKFHNSGQVCINVNHVLVHPSLREQLVERLVHYFEAFQESKDKPGHPLHYTHIINDRNFSRLSNLLDSTKGRVAYGGTRDAETLFFPPAVVVDVKPDDPLMAEEIFGPILPVIDATLDEAIAITAAGEHPLALYAFTADEADKQRILNATRSGGVTFNDCFLHAGMYDAPFGGVGTSGMGNYHGHYGVLAFSHLRTTAEGPPKWMDKATAFRFPPYTDENAKKVEPPKAWFDHDGRDKLRLGAPLQWFVGAMFASIAWVLRK